MAAASSVAAILGAAAASSAASVYNNQQNIKYAGEANDVSVGLANTAHQREVRDLEAAGLNPILSATSKGADVPQLRTPTLENISGGIGNSGKSLARAINGLTNAEVASAQANATTAKAFADNSEAIAEAEKIQQEALAYQAKSESAGWVYEGVNNQLDAMARYEAISGNQSDLVAEHITTKEGWKTYNNLVQQYRNEIETGRYKSSIGRVLFSDVLDSVSSAKGLKSKVPSRRSSKRGSFSLSDDFKDFMEDVYRNGADTEYTTPQGKDWH